MSARPAPAGRDDVGDGLAQRSVEVAATGFERARATAATSAPSAAHRTAIACPMPRLAPVTITTLPSSAPTPRHSHSRRPPARRRRPGRRLDRMADPGALSAEVGRPADPRDRRTAAVIAVVVLAPFVALPGVVAHHEGALDGRRRADRARRARRRRRRTRRCSARLARTDGITRARCSSMASRPYRLLGIRRLGVGSRRGRRGRGGRRRRCPWLLLAPGRAGRARRRRARRRDPRVLPSVVTPWRGRGTRSAPCCRCSPSSSRSGRSRAATRGCSRGRRRRQLRGADPRRHGRRVLARSRRRASSPSGAPDMPGPAIGASGSCRSPSAVCSGSCRSSTRCVIAVANSRTLADFWTASRTGRSSAGRTRPGSSARSSRRPPVDHGAAPASGLHRRGRPRHGPSLQWRSCSPIALVVASPPSPVRRRPARMDHRRVHGRGVGVRRRIVDEPFEYLVRWTELVGVTAWLTIGWVALELVRATDQCPAGGACSGRQQWRGDGGRGDDRGAGRAASTPTRCASARPSSTCRLDPQLAQLAPALRGPVVVRAAADLNSAGRGLGVRGLVAHGVDARFRARVAGGAGAHTLAGEPARTQLLVHVRGPERSAGDRRAQWGTASVDELSPSQRAELERLRSSFSGFEAQVRWTERHPGLARRLEALTSHSARGVVVERGTPAHRRNPGRSAVGTLPVMRAWRVHELGEPDRCCASTTSTTRRGAGRGRVRRRRRVPELPRCADVPGRVPGAAPAAVHPRLRGRPAGRRAGTASTDLLGRRVHRDPPVRRRRVHRADGGLGRRGVPDPGHPRRRAAASALHITYATGHIALHRRARLQPGETLLVHAGAGGIGSAPRSSSGSPPARA